jgi:hypothetical protein
MPYKHTIEAAESRHAAMAEQRAKQIALDKVSRVVRKSAVNGLDMQHFFGTSLRPNAVIDLPHKICVEGPATETLTIEANSDLGLPHELLEAILSHLPVLDLIIATGVNMTFRTIVQESPTLQRKLFLRATNEPRRFVRLEHPDWGYEVAVATQEEYADVDDADEYERDGTQWGVAREAVTPSPFLISEDDQDRSRTERHRETEVVCFTETTALAEHWANMYLTNPPCEYVTINLFYRGGYHGQYSISASRKIYRRKGVTLASLLGAFHMEGDVDIDEHFVCWAHEGSLDEDMVGVYKATTVSRMIAKFEEWRKAREDVLKRSYNPLIRSIELRKMGLDLSRTTIKLWNVVVPEWRTDEGDFLFRSMFER